MALGCFCIRTPVAYIPGNERRERRMAGKQGEAMKPPFSYYGGKQRIAHKIIPYIPRHTVYVEPFCGAATILFQKPLPPVTNTDYYREVINDINSDVYNFFRVLRGPDSAELCRQLSLMPYSNQEYREVKQRMKAGEGTDIGRAVDYYVNVQMSFANTLNGGWGFSVLAVNHAKTFRKNVNNLPVYIDRISELYVENIDALKCIEKWDSPHTFFYCDPPYPGADQGHYSGYTIKDYKALIEKLKGIEGAAIISNYAQDVEIPASWRRIEIESRNTSANGRDRIKEHVDNARTEVMLIKARTGELRPDIARVMMSSAFDCFGQHENEKQMKLFP